MRRWVLPAISGLYWVILALSHGLAGDKQPRAGTDTLSQLLAAPVAWCAPLRSLFMHATHALPNPGGALLAGFTLGDTSRSDESLTAAMKATSLTHLTAVSGANCQVVLMCAILLLSWMGLSRRWRLLGAVCVLVFFVALVEPAASVARAAVMSIAVLIGLASGRLVAGLPALALSVIVLLVIEPLWAISFGFTLSVFATAGLLLLSEPCAQWLARIPVVRRLPQPARLVIAVPLVTNMVCLPVLVALTPSLPLYGVIANVLTVPVAEVGTIAGLIVLVFCLVWLPFGMILAWLAWLPAQWVGEVAFTFANLPLARLAWFDSLLGVVTAALLTASFVIVIASQSQKWRRMRRVATGFIGIAMTVSLVMSMNFVLTARAIIPSDWQIAACDVGQGDGFIVRARANDGFHYAMVDTGRFPTLIHSCVVRLGIKRIDLLVLSHYDQDHVGGTSGIVSVVDHAIVGLPVRPADRRLVQLLVRNHVILERGLTGMTGNLGWTRWRIMWPDGHTPGMQSGNPGSITMFWQLNGFTACFTGDLNEQAQDTLLQTVLDIPHVDVLKVAHHGSADTSPEFTARLHPEVGLISVGKNNGYGHPTQRALSILEALGTRVFRTDLQGMLFVSFRHNRLVVTTDR